MKLHEQIFFEIKNENIDYKSYGQLFSKLSEKLGKPVDNIAKCVNKMILDGELVEDHKRKLVAPCSLKLSKGTVCGNPKGFAFVSPKREGHQGFEYKKGQREDVFVPASMLFGAFDGDEVLFRLEGKDSGSVVKILKRGNKSVVGKLIKGNNSIYKGHRLDSENYFVIPDNVRFSKPVLIPSRDIGEAKEGDKVSAILTFQPEGAKCSLPVGKVAEIVKGDDIEQGIKAIMVENQIPDVFPEKVLAEAENLTTDFEKEKRRRVDLTGKLIVTIDGADAKDLDDAISLEKDGDEYVLGIHIADVGNYVKYKSEIDKEAFMRGTSVYFPGRVYPMLPKRLSNDLCSLNANEEKLALTVEVRLNKFAEVVSYRIYESVIKSSYRLTYTQVQNILGDKLNTEESKVLSPEEVKRFLQNGSLSKKAIEMLLDMNQLSAKLGNARRHAGALDLELSETYFDMDGNNILDIRKRERNDAYKLIENFMVLANRVVAEAFCKLDIPFVYRIHGEPSKIRVQEVVEVLNEFGVDIKQSKHVDAKYIQYVLEQVKKTDFAEVGSMLVLRALEKAIYAEECLGHFGLALQYYCHFTSPIRRYPDLTIHRIIKKALSVCKSNILTSEQMNTPQIKKLFKGNYDLEEFVIDSAFQSSERERKADEAERQADDLFKAKFMENKIGEVYEGRISGISSFGIFVELENTIEGLIKIETLPPDDYNYDERKFVLKGKKRKFSIGQNIKIKVISANVETRKIDFLLCEWLKNTKKLRKNRDF